MKRRPKGMGSVTYLGNGRRRPYLATINKKCIGTYTSNMDAEKALLLYCMKSYNILPSFINDIIANNYTDFIYAMQQNRLLPDSVRDFPNMDMINEMFINKLKSTGEYDMIDSSVVQVPTFAEIWKDEFDRLSSTKSSDWIRGRNVSFKHLEPLHDISIAKIKLDIIQQCFDNAMSMGSGESKLNGMKRVCSIVYECAIRNEYISPDKDYSKRILYQSTSKRINPRKPFTNDEIHILMDDESLDSKLVLIYIFTGMRPIELLTLKRKNIHIDERYMVGGVKTDSGRDRIIPIHKIIQPYLKELLEGDGMNLLFTNKTNATLYHNYNIVFKQVMERLHLDHVEPYDTRYTFSTLAKVCHLDTAAHKKIMGHICNDITDDVYTHEPISFLINEIDKITC